MAANAQQRIVSLIASATEIVCALGAREQLVGRSHECDFPPDVMALPALTAPKFKVEGTSAEIDERVRAIVRDGLSVYRVDGEALAALAPDIIVTQDHCEVCAVSERDVNDALSHWSGERPQVVSLRPNSLADVWDDIARVAAALGREREGEQLVRSMRRGMAAIAKRSQSLPHKPTVACIEWIDPLMAAGNWMPELVEMAGGINLFGEAGRHSPWLTWEALRAADPEVILVSPCGYDVPKTLREMSALVSQPGWDDLRAVRSHCVAVADGNQYFHRPGPRLVESLEILASILHPEATHTPHPVVGWSRWVG
jgi:iron complex transport system substrate-binding protein